MHQFLTIIVLLYRRKTWTDMGSCPGNGMVIWEVIVYIQLLILDLCQQTRGQAVARSWELVPILYHFCHHLLFPWFRSFFFEVTKLHFFHAMFMFFSYFICQLIIVMALLMDTILRTGDKIRWSGFHVNYPMKESQIVIIAANPFLIRRTHICPN